MKRILYRTLAAIILGLTPALIQAQSVVQTVQQIVIGPTPDKWSFTSQIVPFAPANPGDKLASVQIDFTMHTDFPGFSATATKANSQGESDANWDVIETVLVKNLRVTDDSCDEDEDDNK